jgi:hypothetical protein
MGGKNKMLELIEEAKRVGFQAGLTSGRQQIIDIVSLVLRDPKIMGKDTFGGKRLVGVVEGTKEYIEMYSLAWQKHDDTDYWQKRLDDALAEAYGEKLHDSFHIRYPYAPEYDYVKGKWKK